MLTKQFWKIVTFISAITIAMPSFAEEQALKSPTTKRVETTIDPTLAGYAIICLGVGACTTLLVAGTIGVVAIWKMGPDSELITYAIREGLILRMATIFGIVSTAGFLALTGALTEGAITFLSGISGYVLGSASRTSATGIPRTRRSLKQHGDETREEPDASNARDQSDAAPDS